MFSIYRYGFNGKENDDEVKGEGNQQDYGMRIYDPRLGRFLSVDPISSSYPELTPCQFASNTPIWAIDLDGLEGFIATGMPNKYGYGHGMIISVQDAGKVNQEIISWVRSNHQKGMLNWKIAEEARQMAIKQGRPNGDNITFWTKLGVYLSPWWNKLAPYSDANDGAVLMTGENLDGSVATRGDYVAASFGVALPIISGNAIKKIYSLIVNGTGADKLGQIVRKVENISTALDEKHVKAAVNDILGNPIIINGKTYDHLDEVQNALRGIGNQIGELNKLINSGSATEDVLSAAKKIRSELQIKKDAINDVLNRAKKKSTEND